MKVRLGAGVCFLLISISLLSTSLFGQTFRGTILGTVTDPQGAVVAGATVNVRNVNTGLERSTATSGDGSYSVPELPIGTYTVTVSQTGFQKSVTSNVAVDVASEKRVDVSMKTGQVSEIVQVSGDTLPLVETTSADRPLARNRSAVWLSSSIARPFAARRSSAFAMCCKCPS